jgi:sorbitol/mannitol transport system substrate-binding protein
MVWGFPLGHCEVHARVRRIGLGIVSKNGRRRSPEALRTRNAKAGRAVISGGRNPEMTGINDRPDETGGSAKTTFTRGEILKLGGILAAGSAAAPLMSACGGSAGSSGGEFSGTTLTVATVSNSQMEDMQTLIGHFTEKTGINVRFLFLPENDLRQRVTQDVAMQAGNFDIVTIGSYDTPFWGRYQWITSLDPFLSRMSSAEKKEYDLPDLLESIRTILSNQGKLFAAPFYAESSMLFYRKDLFEKAGIKMPERPTWKEITGFAEKLNKQGGGAHAMILRGLPGWGANMAPFDTFFNTYGGRWFDLDWRPQLESPEFKKAVSVYADLVTNYGQPGATSDNFPECENLFASGDGAMWYDATSAAGYISDPKTSKVANQLGYTYGPTGVTEHGAHWLWSWALGIESASKNQDAAFEFIKWATSKEYIDLVGRELGWVRVPPGTRRSTYQDTKYKDNPWAEIEINSIEDANPERPSVDPVPYTGIQYVGIPEFQQLGDEVGRSLASVLAGDMSVDEMAQKSQQQALEVVRLGQYLKN